MGHDLNSDLSAESVRTFGSLFSGIGGIDLGLERAGFRVIWQAETEPYASKVLAKHWPDVPNLGDVTKVDWDGVDRPDVVAGGFPCQPWSVAGKRRGKEDDRWLWPEFVRCIRHLRPRYVLVENVPGLLVGGLGDVLGDLAEIGFDADWASIPAAAVGAPHLRWRVFVVAYADSQGSQGHRPEHQLGTPRQEAAAGGRGDVGDTQVITVGTGLRQAQPAGFRWGRPSDSGWWTTEPGLGRVAHGIPARVDRLRCLGNAVVPQVAEYVGRQLAAHIDGVPHA